jgi:hypothetical protein
MKSRKNPGKKQICSQNPVVTTYFRARRTDRRRERRGSSTAMRPRLRGLGLRLSALGFRLFLCLWHGGRRWAATPGRDWLIFSTKARAGSQTSKQLAGFPPGPRIHRSAPVVPFYLRALGGLACLSLTCPSIPIGLPGAPSLLFATPPVL